MRLDGVQRKEVLRTIVRRRREKKGQDTEHVPTMNANENEQTGSIEEEVVYDTSEIKPKSTTESAITGESSIAGNTGAIESQNVYTSAQELEQQQPARNASKRKLSNTSTPSLPDDEDRPRPKQQQQQRYKHRIKHPPPSQELILGYHENDVLMGRGATINSHPGNIRFRNMCAMKKTEFDMATNSQKRGIALELVEDVMGVGSTRQVFGAGQR